MGAVPSWRWMADDGRGDALQNLRRGDAVLKVVVAAAAALDSKRRSGAGQTVDGNRIS